MIRTMSIKRYSELVSLPTFEERYRYLRLSGRVCEETFGFERYLNQVFYRSPEWRRIRDEVILRDCGCDLACKGREIFGQVIIHHMNPINARDIRDRSDFLLNPEFLICTTPGTHQAIHYGDESLLIIAPVTRARNDTCPWKHA